MKDFKTTTTTSSSYDVDYDLDDIPQEFLCPLTLQVFENPLVNMYGMNYERSAIVEWLDRGNQVCPLTRRPLSLSGLIHNHALKTRIMIWKAEQDEQRVSASAIASVEAEGKDHNSEQFCASEQNILLKQVGFVTVEEMNQEIQRRRQEEKKSSRRATTTATASTSSANDSSTRRNRRNWLFSRRKTGRSAMHTTA